MNGAFHRFSWFPSTMTRNSTVQLVIYFDLSILFVDRGHKHELKKYVLEFD